MGADFGPGPAAIAHHLARATAELVIGHPDIVDDFNHRAGGE